MDISIETVLQAEVFRYPYQAFHGIIGITHYARTQKQSLDVVAPVELHSQVDQFGHRKRGTRNVVAHAVDAIGTIVDAIIGQHDFQQRDAPPVFGKAMADADAAHRIAHASLRIAAHRAARCARHIVFRRFGKHFQFM